MDEVVALDPEAHAVTVNAGITYGQLCPYLHTRGFALHNLAVRGESLDSLVKFLA